MSAHKLIAKRVLTGKHRQTSCKAAVRVSFRGGLSHSSREDRPAENISVAHLKKLIVNTHEHAGNVMNWKEVDDILDNVDIFETVMNHSFSVNQLLSCLHEELH